MRQQRSTKEANELFKTVFERVAKGELPTIVCRELGLSTSGYYRRRKRPEFQVNAPPQAKAKACHKPTPTLVNVEIPVIDPIVEVTTIRLPLSQVEKLFSGRP